MPILNTFETEQVNDILAKAQKDAEKSRDDLAATVLKSGAAYAMRWSRDALDKEARYRALMEVHSFYSIDIEDFGAAEAARTAATRAADYRAMEKVRWICVDSNSETEQARDAQAYAWALSIYNEALAWAASDAKRAQANDAVQLQAVASASQ